MAVVFTSKEAKEYIEKLKESYYLFEGASFKICKAFIDAIDLTIAEIDNIIELYNYLLQYKSNQLTVLQYKLERYKSQTEGSEDIATYSLVRDTMKSLYSITPMDIAGLNGTINAVSGRFIDDMYDIKYQHDMLLMLVSAIIEKINMLNNAKADLQEYKSNLG